MLKERTKLVLDAAVRDYITVGKPVTSESLFGKYDFGIKPAMIRWELCALGEDDYFYQNHPSGGRIPTDKAYRFFINELLDSGEEARTSNRFEDLIENFFEGERTRLIEKMAGYLKTLSVGYEPETDWFMKSGFRNMLENLALTDRDEILEVVDDFENLSARLTKTVGKWHEEDEWPQVFLGKSPITKSPHLAVMVDCFRPANQELFVMVIGPKRMDYEKSLNVLRSLEREF
ncbi:hypothetical protein A2116_00215 [Candidatus Jorgensenbacteria bacterium GWA1_49_17]|uniref:Heat-inducible transcription repressor HrcA C-terminal domain-containing protein n=2 Tax=Candidatus Joergenseniibacteriota TaxID=1752739 RepID=A0A1F6BMC8_9BACT|nr:MAG: hypothetical protein A2127_02510 [Candidatus Jorgensenbacteria bacterium GWC1_48_12]OGG40060.1 MAG: hypothetical protein A2116_00215 [Candidatus Jorgensenbacteria bacterium GWA1_49_17]